MRLHTLEQMKQACQSSQLQTLFKKSHQIWSASRILDAELHVTKINNSMSPFSSKKVSPKPCVLHQFGPTCWPEDYNRPLPHSLLGQHSRRQQISRSSVSPSSPAPQAPRPHPAFSCSSAWHARYLNPFLHSSCRPWPPSACCNPQQKPPPHHHCRGKFTTQTLRFITVQDRS